MFGLISKKKHADAIEDLEKLYDWKMAKSMLEGYYIGFDDGRSKAITEKLTTNEIREALGLPICSTDGGKV